MSKMAILKSSRGSVFVMTLVFSSIFTIMGIGLLRFLEHGAEVHVRNMEIIKSHWAAEAAQQLSLRYLSETWQLGAKLPTINDSIGFTPKSNTAELAKLNGYDLPFVHFRTADAGEDKKSYSMYCGVFVKEADIVNTISYFEVTPAAMSTFTLLANRTPANPWVDLMVDGNFHINDRVNIGHTMTDTTHVTGTFTVANAELNGMSAPYNKGIRIVDTDDTTGTFPHNPALIGLTPAEQTAWLKRRIPRFSSIGNISLDKVSSGAFTQGMTLPRDARSWSGDNVRYRFVFNYGTLHISIGNPYSGYMHLQDVAIASIPNRTIIVDDEVSIKGVLQGQLTIVTTDKESHGGGGDLIQHDINIIDDVVYADRDIVPGQGDGLSKDFLTLVSGGDIKFAMHSDHAGSTEATRYYYNYNYDQTVCASMFAPNGTIRHEYPAYFWNKPLRNYHIYGSAIVDRITSTIEDGYGFVLNYHKDPRYFLAGTTAPKVGSSTRPDPEISGTTLRWSLNLGKWENQIIIPD